MLYEYFGPYAGVCTLYVWQMILYALGVVIPRRANLGFDIFFYY